LMTLMLGVAATPAGAYRYLLRRSTSLGRGVALPCVERAKRQRHWRPFRGQNPPLDLTDREHVLDGLESLHGAPG
jgi:hypothetical protein